MILVTGGTGLVGSHLLYRLVLSNDTVRATFRNTKRLDTVKKVFSYYSDDAATLFGKIDWVQCDITDSTGLADAFENITKVYHCAALISFDPNDRKRLYKTNVVGTANVVNLCLANQVEKLCHVSSIAAIGPGLDGTAVTEETEWQEAEATVYGTSKYQAEMEVWRGSQEGLATVMVNPGVIVGPGFFKSGSGLFFHSVGKEKPYYLPSGTGFVTVMDTVNAMLLLMETAISNERFILVNDHLTFKAFAEAIAGHMGKKPPSKALSLGQLALLWRLDWLKTVFTGSARRLSKQLVATFRKTETYDAKKIRGVEGFQFEDLREVIAQCAAIYIKESFEV